VLVSYSLSVTVLSAWTVQKVFPSPPPPITVKAILQEVTPFRESWIHHCNDAMVQWYVHDLMPLPSAACTAPVHFAHDTHTFLLVTSYTITPSPTLNYLAASHTYTQQTLFALQSLVNQHTFIKSGQCTSSLSSHIETTAFHSKYSKFLITCFV